MDIICYKFCQLFEYKDVRSHLYGHPTPPTMPIFCSPSENEPIASRRSGEVSSPSYPRIPYGALRLANRQVEQLRMS